MTNSIEGHELALYAMNDYGIYQHYTMPALRNLAKHKKAGRWDRNKALKSLQRVATEAAKHYRREHCGMTDKWHEIFPVPARIEAAAEMLEHYDELINELAES